MAKFSQNPWLLDELKSTGDTTLVEASPFDCIWGIGLRASDPAAQNRENWRGLNWLGEVLTSVRGFLQTVGIAIGGKAGFDWQAFKFAVVVTAPALILHELFHKFAGLYYGLSASFNAAYFFLGIGVALKLMRFPFIFFVPAYVSIACKSASCILTPSSSALIAFAGPFANLLLFAGAWALLKYGNLSHKWKAIAHITKQINLILLVLNLLPIPGFDGFKVYTGLWQAFF